MITIPSEKAYLDLMKYEISFFIEINPYKEIIIYLKLTSDLFISVFNGVPIQIVLRNPLIDKYSATLYILDVIEAPYFFTKKFEHEVSENFKGMIKLSDFVNGDYSRVIISMFDENMQNKFAREVKLKTVEEPFEKWFFRVTAIPFLQKKPHNGEYFPESSDIGYAIDIINKYNPTAIKIINGEKQLIDTNKEANYFSLVHYENIGKQGYLQEQNLRFFLSSIFTPGFYLYHSIFKSNKEELTDFLVFYDYSFILIESKCIKPFKEGEIKNIKSSEHALSNAIVKACNQLINAELELINNPQQFYYNNPPLAEQTIFAKNYIKLCLINDPWLINKERITSKLKLIQCESLPIILSIHDFYFLFKRYQPEKAIQILLNIKAKIEEEELSFPLFHLKK